MRLTTYTLLVTIDDDAIGPGDTGSLENIFSRMLRGKKRKGFAPCHVAAVDVFTGDLTDPSAHQCDDASRSHARMLSGETKCYLDGRPVSLQTLLDANDHPVGGQLVVYPGFDQPKKPRKRALRS